MMIQTKKSIGDTVKFRPFGKLTPRYGEVVSISAFVGMKRSSVEYAVKYNDEIWSVDEIDVLPHDPYQSIPIEKESKDEN